MKKNMLVCLVMLLLTISTGKTYAAKKNVVLVFPARRVVVQMAFDIAWLRKTELVSYSKDAEGNLLLWRWMPQNRQWNDYSLKAFHSELLMRSEKADVVIIGDDKEAIAAIEAAAEWAGSIKSLDNLNKVPVFEELDKQLSFKAGEWRWLAERHNITLQDTNWLRRRYGRWGPPQPKKEKADSAGIELEPRREFKGTHTVEEVVPADEVIEFEQVITDDVTDAESMNAAESGADVTAPLEEGKAIKTKKDYPALPQEDDPLPEDK